MWAFLEVFICDKNICFHHGNQRGRPQGGGQNGNCPPLEIGINNQKILEKPEVSSLIPINWFSSYTDSFFTGMMHCTKADPGSQSWCHATMSLQFIHVPSFACRGRLRKLRAGCSTDGLYWARIAWQQIFKGSLHVAVAGVLLHGIVERKHLGRQCNVTVTVDSGKARTFTLCGKYEWIFSNASTSFKNPLLMQV